MANLLETSYVQEKFPLWRTYCTIDESELTAEQMLELQIEMAEDFMSGYVTISSLTDHLKLLELWIVKKYCWNLQHDDLEFDPRPQVLVDYDKAVEYLEKYQSGELPHAPAPGAAEDTWNFSQRDRVFGTDGNFLDWEASSDQD